MTLWMEGLSKEADAGNVTIFVSGVPHYPESVEVEKGQTNVRLRPLICPGSHPVTAVHRGATSNPVMVEVVGPPPLIKGLESLAPV